MSGEHKFSLLDTSFSICTETGFKRFRVIHQGQHSALRCIVSLSGGGLHLLSASSSEMIAYTVMCAIQLVAGGGDNGSVVTALCTSIKLLYVEPG